MLRGKSFDIFGKPRGNNYPITPILVGWEG